MTYQKPLPEPTSDDKFFWDGCKQHRLLFQKCGDCGLVRWPPDVVCPKCYSRKAEIVASAGKGRLYTYAIYHRAYHPAFVADLPYITAVIEMAEGPHFLSNIVGAHAQDLKCDMSVEVVWEDIAPGITLPKFWPAP